MIYNKIYYDSLNKNNEYFVLDVSYDDYLYINKNNQEEINEKEEFVIGSPNISNEQVQEYLDINVI